MITGTLFTESLAPLSLFLPSWWGSSERLCQWDKRQCCPLLMVLIVVGDSLQWSGLMEQFAVERECLFPNSCRLSFLLSLPASFITIGRSANEQSPRSVSRSRRLWGHCSITTGSAAPSVCSVWEVDFSLKKSEGFEIWKHLPEIVSILFLPFWPSCIFIVITFLKVPREWQKYWPLEKFTWVFPNCRIQN